LIDEFNHDVPHNRVIKATLRALLTLPGLDEDLRGRLREHVRRLQDVSDVDLAPDAFRSIQLHRNIAGYGFLIEVCRLVSRSFLPDERSGARRFRPFTASEQEMGLVFERFVRNFLRREQDAFKVAGAKVPWCVETPHGESLSWLPEMRVDVMLTSATRRVALEVKYYATPYQSHHGSRTLISSHLYQLLTYLSHLGEIPGPTPIGVLLYARSGEEQCLDYRLGGHTLLVRSLDLNREWREIHASLVALARELEELSEMQATA
jgi:5-methylcytosine-specific restriction enzyme subunit McrC